MLFEPSLKRQTIQISFKRGNFIYVQRDRDMNLLDENNLKSQKMAWTKSTYEVVCQEGKLET